MMHYNDLPKELSPFFDARDTGIHRDYANDIREGWGKMTRRERDKLVKLLRAEPSELKRVLILLHRVKYPVD